MPAAAHWERTSHGLGLIGLVVVAIAFLTLTPVDQSQNELKVFSLCVLCKPATLVDALQNVVLFVPLGFALAFRLRGIWVSTLCGALLSLVIELSQFHIPGRYPALQDIITNASGTAIGWGVTRSWVGPALRCGVASARQSCLRCVRPDETLARFLALGFTLMAVTVLLLTGWLLSPRLPEGRLIVSSKSLDSTDFALRIGSNGEADGYFNGDLDEIRIYARALSREEILAEMRHPVVGESARSKKGLVAAFGFEEAGGTIAIDSSGRGNDGRISGAERVRGYFGRALAFDGTNGEVIVRSAPELKPASQLTLAAWVRPATPRNSWPSVIQKGRDDYFLYAGADRILIPNGGGKFGGASEAAAAPFSLEPGRWVHLATTYDGASLSLYVDGRPVARLDRWYAGEVQRTTIGSTQLNPGFVASDWLAEALASGETITLRGIAGPPNMRRGALLDIRNAFPGDRALWLGHDHSDLILREFTVAQSLGLPFPEIRSPGALKSLESGKPFEISVSGHAGQRAIGVNGAITAAVGHSVGMGWGIATESRYTPLWAQEALAVAWIAALAFPAGFWSRTLLVRMMAIGTLGAALLLVPAVTALAPTPPSQWIAAFSAFLAATLLGRVRPAAADSSLPTSADT